jgi:diphosphomevalonate decarboxylase
MEKIFENSWESPSNIAFIKYWGKRRNQEPCNPSISMTLKNARSRFETRFYKGSGEFPEDIDFYFEGRNNKSFGSRLVMLYGELKRKYKILADVSLSIHASNTFPHSAGIASSASSLSAFTLSVLDYVYQSGGMQGYEHFLQEASYFSRIGSGSACRSIYAPFSLWGNTSFIGSSDRYAISIHKLHSDFMDLNDAVLILDKSPKPVSSSKGHVLMKMNPFAQVRFKQAIRNTEELYSVMQQGDIERFVEIIEIEALSLHAMMMTSGKGYVLLSPESLAVISRIRDFRERTGIMIGFTIDAGPNIHLIFMDKDKNQIMEFIENELFYECKVQEVLYDCAGTGPRKLK